MYQSSSLLSTMVVFVGIGRCPFEFIAMACSLLNALYGWLLYSSYDHGASSCGGGTLHGGIDNGFVLSLMLAFKFISCWSLCCS
jgi:hypothetical protein